MIVCLQLYYLLFIVYDNVDTIPSEWYLTDGSLFFIADLFDGIATTEVATGHKFECFLLLASHRFLFYFSEEGGQVDLLQLFIFVKVQPNQKVLGAALSTAVRSK